MELKLKKIRTMKKTIIALGLGAFIAIAFSSCQKKYTCTCSTGDLKDPF